MNVTELEFLFHLRRIQFLVLALDVVMLVGDFMEAGVRTERCEVERKNGEHSFT